MKLMIEIPEEDYIRLRDEGMFGNVTTFKRAVKEGVPISEPAPCVDVSEDVSEDVSDINDGNIYECPCGYGWDKSKVVRHHFCPNCGRAVNSTEQEPCDAVSRKEVMTKILALLKTMCGEVDRMPSVIPQYTDAEIQKMQDLEFAEIQKAYEIGKEEGNSEKPNKWIPVSERLPKIADVYRVTRYYPNNVMNPRYLVDACCFDGFNTWYNDNRINHERDYANNVIAWQENPEPYKEG